MKNKIIIIICLLAVFLVLGFYALMQDTVFKFTKEPSESLNFSSVKSFLGEYIGEIKEFDRLYNFYYNEEDFRTIYNVMVSDDYRTALSSEEHSDFLTNVFEKTGKHVSSDFDNSKISIQKISNLIKRKKAVSIEVWVIESFENTKMDVSMKFTFNEKNKLELAGIKYDIKN